MNTNQQKQEQPQKQTHQSLSWEQIGKLTKAEYEARRDEVQKWISSKTSRSGKVLN